MKCLAIVAATFHDQPLAQFMPELSFMLVNTATKCVVNCYSGYFRKVLLYFPNPRTS
jgi:hypothetical protein